MKQDRLATQHETKQVADLVHLYERGMLNLSPTFQRQSVWKDKDRELLIQSLIRGFPIPAVFLYRRHEDGQLRYDVIDGKQRLETILRFMGSMRPSFTVKSDVPGLDGLQNINAASLKRNRKHMDAVRPLLQSYRVPVIEVDGELGDIVELFVRINSTGKALTPQERRNARYSGSALLKAATALANKLEGRLDSLGVFSATQKSRMKHVEFAAELIMSMQAGDVINKKAAVDRVMASATVPARELEKAAKHAFAAVGRVARIFPKLATTRFHQVVDFYTLVVLIGKLDTERSILIDKKRNALAWDLLRAFGTEVDRVREAQRLVQGTGREQETYRDYLMTVSQMTDDISQRRQREKILRAVIAPLFAQRDAQRGFTAEQRRILWNSTEEQKCKVCGCKLSWDNFTVDHVDPHSRGGRSRLDNAALVCRACNSVKGNRTTVGRKAVVRQIGRSRT
jgi:hypothetical protein